MHSENRRISCQASPIKMPIQNNVWCESVTRIRFPSIVKWQTAHGWLLQHFYVMHALAWGFLFHNYYCFQRSIIKFTANLQFVNMSTSHSRRRPLYWCTVLANYCSKIWKEMTGILMIFHCFKEGATHLRPALHGLLKHGSLEAHEPNSNWSFSNSAAHL